MSESGQCPLSKNGLFSFKSSSSSFFFWVVYSNDSRHLHECLQLSASHYNRLQRIVLSFVVLLYPLQSRWFFEVWLIFSCFYLYFVFVSFLVRLYGLQVLTSISLRLIVFFVCSPLGHLFWHVNPFLRRLLFLFLSISVVFAYLCL